MVTYIELFILLIILYILAEYIIITDKAYPIKIKRIFYRCGIIFLGIAAYEFIIYPVFICTKLPKVSENISKASEIVTIISS